MSCCSCLTASAILKPEQIKEVQFKNMIAIKKYQRMQIYYSEPQMLDGRLMVGECEPCVLHKIPTIDCFLVTVAIITSPIFLFQTNSNFFYYLFETKNKLKYYLLLQRLLKRCGGIQPRTLGRDPTTNAGE